jgi:hypothetical protein
MPGMRTWPKQWRKSGLAKQAKPIHLARIALIRPTSYLMALCINPR